jgi:DNA-binding beta-propeller fold protein YncE
LTNSSITVINTQTETITKTFVYSGIYPDLGFVLSNDEQYFYLSDNGGANTLGNSASKIYKAVTSTGYIVDTITLESGANPDQIIATNSERYLWVLETGLGKLAKLRAMPNPPLDLRQLMEPYPVIAPLPSRGYLKALVSPRKSSTPELAAPS